MAMMDVEALFIDTNTLVYANITESPFHQQALDAIQAARQTGRPLWTSRQVLREYLVTMTRPQAFANLARETVLRQVEQFTEHLSVADDTLAVTDQLLKLLREYTLGGKQIHDTNIVATMLTYGIPCLLTHNVKDFERFGGLITIEVIVSNA